MLKNNFKYDFFIKEEMNYGIKRFENRKKLTGCLCR